MLTFHRQEGLLFFNMEGDFSRTILCKVLQCSPKGQLYDLVVALFNV